MRNKVLKFLPDFGRKVINRVKEKWEWPTGFPIPNFDIKCPVCGSTELLIRDWGFFIRREGNHKYRCDVSFKCTCCSNVWAHGVVIPEELYHLHCVDNKGRHYLWREVKEIMEREKARSK